jgi:hypothetical protein
MPLQANQLEEMLVENVRSYLADYQSSDELEARRLQQLCSTLTWFFSALVRGHEKRDQFYGIDDVVALSVEVRPHSELALKGYAIVYQYKQVRKFMMEPFSASLQLAEMGNRLRAYRIKCGDANRQFATIPYSVSIRAQSRMVSEEWLFTFESEQD